MTASNIVSRESFEMALSGQKPALGHTLTAEELGQRLAQHRRGRYPGQPFTKQAMSLYRLHPEQQSADFVEAFRSWFAAETLRQEKLRLRVNGTTIDELLSEAGYVQQVGDDPVKAILAVGQLPPHSLIHVNGTASVVEFTGQIERCACGTLFAKRAWNQKRCSVCRKGER